MKRTRHVKVHALLIGYLKNQMPSIFGKAAKQQELLDNMADVFRTVQREYHIPYGDFPSLENFCNAVRDYDFSKFPKLDLKYAACVHLFPCYHLSFEAIHLLYNAIAPSG